MSRPSAWVAPLGGVAWAVLTAWLALCGSEPAGGMPTWLEPPPVEWGHCGAAIRESVVTCRYAPKQPVRLWVEHPRAYEARVLIDGVEVEAEPYDLAEDPLGHGLRVEVPPGSFELLLEVPEVDGVRVWGIPLEDSGSDGLGLDEMAEVWGSNDPGLIESTTKHEVDELLASGEVEDAVLVLCASSFWLRELRAFDEAERLLGRAQKLGHASAVARSTVAIYRGHLLWSQGALREAAEQLRDGARSSLRVEGFALGWDSLPIYAEALAELGYYEEARFWARESLRLPSSACDRASVQRTAGWVNLLLRAHDEPHDDPRPYLEQAIELYRSDPQCAHKQGGARLSLALLALQDGDVTKAAAELDALEGATLSAEDRVRAADLRVRLRLGTTSAWRAWNELVAAARAVGDDDARWRVDVRLGELLAREGNATAALAAFERAEQRLDRLVRAQAVVGVGRTATADRYLEGTTAWISLLVEQRQPERAFCVTREARARRRSAAAGIDGLPAAERAAVQEQIRRYRAQKQLAEETEALVLARPQAEEPTLRHEAERASRAASELVDEIVEVLMRATASPRCEELVPPAPGELLVGLYPRTHDWLVLVQGEDDTSVYEVPTPSAAELGDPRALGQRLLGPIAAELEGASRVRVLADRQAQAIDVHALPWRGQPLSARVPVAYGVELPARPAPPTDGSPRALLLADPTGTLTSALVEVGEVKARLEQAGWRPDAPATHERSTPLELDFGGYALLHYAAHTATRTDVPQVWAPYPAGEAGGLRHLQLGPQARLEVHDILALRPVPPVAFLAGCKTGLVEVDAGSTSMALAFLLADGQQVVASRENVDDEEGLELARRFYARFGGSAGTDAAVAMHEVQRELWRERGAVVPYRVWVR